MTIHFEDAGWIPVGVFFVADGCRSLVLGNYVVLDELGRGGMGMVLKAEHRRMERVVALKILSAAMTSTPEAVLRFQREVKAAARLEHPNIVVAYDADEADGTHFLVMQFVEGTDLSSLVKELGTLSVDRSPPDRTGSFRSETFRKTTPQDRSDLGICRVRVAGMCGRCDPKPVNRGSFDIDDSNHKRER